MRRSINRAALLLAAALTLSTTPASARPTARDLARAVLFDVRERNDPELTRAVQVVIERGYLAEVPRLWHRLANQPASPDMKKITAVATTWVRRAYPGLPLEPGRTYRRAGTPEHLWYVSFEIDVQPRKDLVVEVDLRSWSVRKVEGVV